MTDSEYLEWFVRRANEVSKAPATPKRRMPKVTRMQRPEMRRATQGSRSAVRSIYQSAERASEQTVTRDVVNPTREVGPGDQYNNVYSTGKETNERRPNHKIL